MIASVCVVILVLGFASCQYLPPGAMIAESGSLWRAEYIRRLALLLGLQVVLVVSNACEQRVVLSVTQ